jgi:hypothetical protein
MAKNQKEDKQDLDDLFERAAAQRALERAEYRSEQEEARKAPLSRDWDALSKKSFAKYRPIKNPKHLWQLACKYFKEMESNPIRKKDFLRGGERAGDIIYVESHRPFTWQSFEAFIWSEGLPGSLEDYKKEGSDLNKEFGEILRVVGSIIFAQKFEGAALGLFKESLIARELGIGTEKGDIEKALNAPAPTAPIIQVFNTAPPMASTEAEVNLAKSVKTE